MTFLEALYGSQYQEIHQRGGDGSKARFNGNLLLAVMVLLGILIFFWPPLNWCPDSMKQSPARSGVSLVTVPARLLAGC